MAKAADASNTFDPALIQNLVGKIEGYFSDLDSERGTYMQRCRGIRESISAVYDEAKARGVPKKELRVFVNGRQALEKARRVLADLEAEQRETVEMLAEAFGDAADLPLFANKIKRTADGAATASAHPH
jgi:hypothetical protein